MLQPGHQASHGLGLGPAHAPALVLTSSPVHAKSSWCHTPVVVLQAAQRRHKYTAGAMAPHGASAKELEQLRTVRLKEMAVCTTDGASRGPAATPVAAAMGGGGARRSAYTLPPTAAAHFRVARCRSSKCLTRMVTDAAAAWSQHVGQACSIASSPMQAQLPPLMPLPLEPHGRQPCPASPRRQRFDRHGRAEARAEINGPFSKPC